MKWKPFGKESNVTVEAFRKGCGSEKCIHVKVDMAMLPQDAIRLINTLLKAVKHSNGIYWIHTNFLEQQLEQKFKNIKRGR